MCTKTKLMWSYHWSVSLAVCEETELSHSISNSRLCMHFLTCYPSGPDTATSRIRTHDQQNKRWDRPVTFRGSELTQCMEQRPIVLLLVETRCAVLLNQKGLYQFAKQAPTPNLT